MPYLPSPQQFNPRRTAGCPYQKSEEALKNLDLDDLPECAATGWREKSMLALRVSNGALDE
jgi:hypothetical protein